MCNKATFNMAFVPNDARELADVTRLVFSIAPNPAHMRTHVRRSAHMFDGFVRRTVVILKPAHLRQSSFPALEKC